MKARWKGTDGQRAAMNKEIRRQILENEENYTLGLGAVMLWALHEEFGFGKGRLLRLWRAFWRIYKEMREFFEMDSTLPIERKLNKIGIDMDELKKVG